MTEFQQGAAVAAFILLGSYLVWTIFRDVRWYDAGRRYMGRHLRRDEFGVPERGA